MRDVAIRTLLSPAGWIVGIAIFLYSKWAKAQYDALTVGACDLGIFYQAVQGWANGGWPMVPIKGYVQLRNVLWHWSYTNGTRAVKILPLCTLFLNDGMQVFR